MPDITPDSASPPVEAPAFDFDFVRRHFPALDEGWTLFDNAGGSVPTRGVIDAVAEFLARWPVQMGASYELSAEASRRVRLGHDVMAQWIGASAGSIVIGPSTTLNLRLLANALRPLWQEGDEVIVTNLDHEANVGPWRALEASGIVIREWRFREGDATLKLEDLDALLGPRTRLVAFTHCSNITGEILDVATIARRVHDAGALVCVDGVAYAPHRRVRVEDWDVDFYALSLYKTYGPHIALLYGRRELLAAARGQYHVFHGEDDVPYKLEPGNPNHELTAALPMIPRYLRQLAEHHGTDDAYPLIQEHETRLMERFLSFLDSKKKVRLVGPPTADGNARVPTLSFQVEGMKSSLVPALLDRRRIAIRWGHFYAYRLIRDLGLLENDGIVRVSMVHYNTPEEVDRLIEALDEVI